jgi:hypothetical protein
MGKRVFVVQESAETRAMRSLIASFTTPKQIRDWLTAMKDWVYAGNALNGSGDRCRGINTQLLLAIAEAFRERGCSEIARRFRTSAVTYISRGQETATLKASLLTRVLDELF